MARTQASVERARALALEGEQLIGSKHYAVDSIRPKCRELQHLCGRFAAEVGRRRGLLGKSLELHSLLEAVRPRPTPPSPCHPPRPRGLPCHLWAFLEAQPVRGACFQNPLATADRSFQGPEIPCTWPLCALCERVALGSRAADVPEAQRPRVGREGAGPAHQPHTRGDPASDGAALFFCHARRVQSLKWCDEGIYLLASQPVDKCQSQEGAEAALQEIEKFLETGAENKIQELDKIYQDYESILTTDLMVSGACARGGGIRPELSQDPGAREVQLPFQHRVPSPGGLLPRALSLQDHR